MTRARTALGLCLFGLFLVLMGARSAAAVTPAGVAISNVASLTYTDAGSSYGTSSNAVSVTVGETIDFTVTAVANLSVVPGSRRQGMVFRLLNVGNAPRAFALAIDPGMAGDSFDPTGCEIWLNRVAGSTSQADETPYVRGEEPMIAPGEALIVVTTCDIPDAAAGEGMISLTARPQMRTGETAVSVWTPARATATSTYIVGGVLRAELIKSQSVADRLGRPRALKGATITYTLLASVQGAGVAKGLVISDPIPAGTTYVPGSLRLDGQALSDGAGDDLGQAGADGVSVALGDVAAPAQRAVTFQVLINP